MKSTNWQPVSAITLYNHIAHAVLGRPTVTGTAQLGCIALHEHQHDAVQRLTKALDEFGGALLADSVGLGKTYVALALASRYDHAHIVAPATLLPMWRQALRDAEIFSATVHSLQSLSRKPLKPCQSRERCLVIIDEAHHLRTRNTIRYANAAQFVANRHVLLLSATPIHNRPRELQNLLALFLGRRADALDERSLAQYIIRRTGTPAITHAVPRVREHPPFAVPENSQVLEALMTLPPPLPAKDGAAAGALIRLGLLQAWCSSDAALTDSLRRRELRGEAMLHSLAHGRYPTQHELKSYIISTDAIQLGFPELLVATAAADSAALLQTLSVHLDGLHHLLQLHIRVSNADAERSSILRSLLHRAPTNYAAATHSGPIIAFSHFASTVRALHRALSDLAGVASLTSQGGRIASGVIGRQELIAQFAPRAHERPPPPEHQRIQLLLTTDLLSEGVNLQDAATLVHLDLPWTDAARAQRVGRLARLGSYHEFVDVFTFAPPPGMDATLRIVQTLKRKAMLSATFVGADATGHSTTAPEVAARESATLLATRVHDRMKAWLSGPLEPCDQPVVARVKASRDDWIAVVICGGRRRVITSMSSQTDDLFSELSKAIGTIHALDQCDDGGCSPSELSGSSQQSKLEVVVREIESWRRSENLRELTGPIVRALPTVNAAALRAISRCVALTSPAARTSIVALVRNAEHIAMMVRGAGAEQALGEWCAQSHALPTSEWLRSITRYPALSGVRRESASVHGSHELATSFRVEALLLLSTG